MSSLRRRSTITVLLLCAITLLVAACGGGGGGSKTAGGKQRSSIWKVGTTWTVTVLLDSAMASPDKTGSKYDQIYRFKVIKAPGSATGAWVVRATLDGAEGPLKEGFRLYYVAKGSAMVLDGVALGADEPVDPDAAPVIVGQSFPLTTRYDKPPRSHREEPHDSTMSTVPPSSKPPPIPNEPGSNGTVETGGEIPDGPPNADVVPGATTG